MEKMFLKFGILILCVLVEIALGIYTYLNFENLLFRFLFFVSTAILVTVIIIKLAAPENPVENKKENLDVETDNSLEEGLEQFPDKEYLD